MVMMNLSPGFSMPFGFFTQVVVAQIFVPQREMRARSDPSSRVHWPLGEAAANAAVDVDSPTMKNYGRATYRNSALHHLACPIPVRTCPALFPDHSECGRCVSTHVSSHFAPTRAYGQSVGPGTGNPSDTGESGSYDLGNSAFKLLMLMWPESSARALGMPATKIRAAKAKLSLFMSIFLSYNPLFEIRAPARFKLRSTRGSRRARGSASARTGADHGS
jgi:hypothetical protein